MLSSVFNIKEIKVLNNRKISAEEIIVISGIEKGNNMFKTNMWFAGEKIEENPYVESVKITRHLDGTIDIYVTERVSTFMINLLTEYAYINNQGYILEISENMLEVPTITGAKTKELKPGERLIREDLEKLDTVIKILDAAHNNNIGNLINEIDITNSREYILILESEGKTVYFGDNSKIQQKILWIVSVIEEERGVPGELFLKNIDRVVFREKV